MIDAIVQRLKDQAGALHSVGIAEDLAALKEGTAPNDGDAFVLPFGDRPEPNEHAMGTFRQLVHSQFLVAFVVRHSGDAKGSERVGMFDSYRTSIEQALAGWAWNSEAEPCELIGGRNAPFIKGASIYVQTWETTRWLIAN